MPPRLAPQLPLPSRPYIPAAGVSPPELLIAEALGLDGAGQQGFSASLFAYGIDLFHAGCCWEAHECWEVLWRREPRGRSRRTALQGLILLAAARVKAAQGRPSGAMALHQRAVAALHSAGGVNLPEIDIGKLANRASAAGVTGPLTLTGRDR